MSAPVVKPVPLSEDGMMAPDYGRFECYRCGRGFPMSGIDRVWEIDGEIEFFDIPVCAQCAAIQDHLTEWLWDDVEYRYSDEWNGAVNEWAYEAMGYEPRYVCLLTGSNSIPLSRVTRLDVVDATQRTAESDADPAWAWGEAAWAAFIWRMQTSPVVNTEGALPCSD